MGTDLITVADDTDQEVIGQLFSRHDLIAVPVLDSEGRMKGIVTVDDIVDVVEEEATEDIQKIGGMEALDAPYLQVGLLSMIRKRAGWLSVLFLGEMLTATAMWYYDKEIARAAVLALFLPLIISSGGNSGSQATTLIIRALAPLRGAAARLVAGHPPRAGRRAGAGRDPGRARLHAHLIWQKAFGTLRRARYLVALHGGDEPRRGGPLGTLTGSMLPFVLRRLGFDPASASAPFVATLVDVTGLIIYFSVASLILRGTLL